MVFKRLSSVGLRINQAKCELSKSSLRFLGYQLSSDGLKPPEGRVTALQNRRIVGSSFVAQPLLVFSRGAVHHLTTQLFLYGILSQPAHTSGKIYTRTHSAILSVLSPVEHHRKRNFHLEDGIAVVTDHKPLIGAFANSTPKISNKQQRKLSFISEFVVDIVHFWGKDNVVADTLSRNITISTHDTAQSNDATDLPAIARAKSIDEEQFHNVHAFDIGIKDKPTKSQTGRSHAAEIQCISFSP